MGKNSKINDRHEKKGPTSQPVLSYTYKNIMLYIYSEQDVMSGDSDKGCHVSDI